MSCTKCKKVPATREECFDRMSDGRAFTNWTPNCTLHCHDKELSKLGSSYDKRIWMINNAEKIIEQQRLSLPSGACVPCFSQSEQGTVLPEYEQQTCNSKYCEFSKDNNMGLGLGRSFSTLK